MLSSFEKNANFHALNLGFFAQKRPSYQERTIMITGLKKKQKTTEIYFNEADDITTISTYNTKLRNRLLEFSKKCPNSVNSSQMTSLDAWYLKSTKTVLHLDA